MYVSAYTKLGVHWVEEGPRGALRASQEHFGLLSVDAKRYIAANVKNKKKIANKQ